MSTKNEKMIENAKSLWDGLKEQAWSKDRLIDLGQKLFAKLPWEKLERDYKLMFLKVSAKVTPDFPEETVNEKKDDVPAEGAQTGNA